METYIKEMKIIQENLLDFIDCNEDKPTDYLFTDQLKIQDDQYKFKSFLYLMINISNNHHRLPNFFIKIKQIFEYLRIVILKYFSNQEIFEIFKSNKRILLILFKLNLIKIDKHIVSQMMKQKYLDSNYPQYFFPEIKEFLDEEKVSLFKTDVEDFEQKREIGENDSFVCKLIQKDLIDEFVIQVNKTNISLKTKIQASIFETNFFLVDKKEITLIEYAAFCGSIQIFKYLLLNNVKLPSTLWLYAIHGCDSSIIHSLEENHVDPPINFEEENNENEEEEEEEERNKKDDCKFMICLKESISCHHNDIANYIMNNYFNMNNRKISLFVSSTCLKNYNFVLIQNELIKSLFFELCKYDHYSIIDLLFKEDYSSSIDFNEVKKRHQIVIKNEKIDKMTDDEIFRQPKIIPVIKQKIRLNTPLFIAIKSRNFNVVKLLLSNEKIDVNIINRGLTVESPATRKLYPNEIRTQQTPLTLAVEIGNIEIINLLLSNKNINANEPRIIDDLHKWGPGPEQGEYITENPALFIAYEKEDKQIFNLLLSNEKVDLNRAKKFTQMNPHGIFERFNINETTLLNKFIEEENLENVKMLLQNNKIDVNAPNKISAYSQYTHFFSGKHTVGESEQKEFALQIAIRKENIEIIKLLLHQKEIDIDIYDENGYEISKSIKNAEIENLFNEIKKENPFQIEPICTFEVSSETMINQRFFLCRTCGINQNDNNVEGCCEVCAHRCHKGHDVFCPSGIVPSFCDCPGSGKCTCNKHETNQKCTGEITNGVPACQPMYQCKDCEINGNSYICQNCAINLHKGHNLTFKYKVKKAICCHYKPSNE